MKGVSFLVYLTIACVWHFQTHAADQISGTADAALAEVALATKSGDLLSVWHAYERLFNHPNREDVDGGLFLSCFRMSACFHLDTLVNVLGKSRDDVRNLINGFCPHFGSWKARVRQSANYIDLNDDAFEKVFLNARAGLHRFNGYDSSCSDWALRIERSASEYRVDRDTSPVVWPLVRVNIGGVTALANEATNSNANSTSNNETWWPVVSYQLGKKIRNAIIDTGTSTTVLQHDDDFPEDLFVQTGEDVVAVGLENDLLRVKTGLLQEIQIGHKSYHNMLISTLPPNVFVDEQDIANLDILGMSMLLQYDSVCFAWKEQRLYLGELGPCAEGLEVSADLSGRSELYVQISTMHESGHWNALFDTGAELTYCSPELFKDKDANVFFLRSNSDLKGTCEIADGLLAADDDFLDPSRQSGIIGLNTLQRFEAWGWQRGPLTNYFVLDKTQHPSD